MSPTDLAAAIRTALLALGANASANGMHSRSEGTGDPDPWELQQEEQLTLAYNNATIEVSLRLEEHAEKAANRCMVFARRAQPPTKTPRNTPHLMLNSTNSTDGVLYIRPVLKPIQRQMLNGWALQSNTLAVSTHGIVLGSPSDPALTERFLEACLRVAAIKAIPPADLDAEALADDPEGRLETTATAVQQARRGQGLFRNLVLARWHGACAVTGCTESALLVAGHIKPWAAPGITDKERLSPDNGIPLVPSLAAAFDRGLITFSADGTILISKALRPANAKALGIQSELCLSDSPGHLMQEFLGHHHTRIFKGPIHG